MTLSVFERSVLTELLEGEHPILRILRTQLDGAHVTSREFTGAGFFSDLAVPTSVEKVPYAGRFAFGDVQATIFGLEYGAGFVLFVDQGYLSFLEGYAYGEAWPETISTFSLLHPRDRSANLAELDRYWPRV
jgi:hypothetical protein